MGQLRPQPVGMVAVLVRNHRMREATEVPVVREAVAAVGRTQAQPVEPVGMETPRPHHLHRVLLAVLVGRVLTAPPHLVSHLDQVRAAAAVVPLRQEPPVETLLVEQVEMVVQGKQQPSQGHPLTLREVAAVVEGRPH